MYYSAVKNVKEHIDGTLESDTQSALTEKKFLQIVSHKKGKSLNPVTPKISLVILLTVCHTIHIMLDWRIWNWVN